MSQNIQPIRTTESAEGPLFRSVRSRRSYAAMVGAHGPRLLTYATQINALDIVDVLGHDPRSDRRKQLADRDLAELYDYMQRKTSSARRVSISNYIEDRLFPKADLVGGFPAVCIAVQYPIEFEPISSANSALDGVVNMSIDTGMHNKRVALDGLGRISGALAHVDQLQQKMSTEAEKAVLHEALGNLSFPCVFYSPRPGQPPLSQEEIGQLFHDFNFKVTPVSAKDAIALDKSDPYIRATYYLAANVEHIDKYGMETKAASLGSKSKAIVVQPVLLRFIRAALEGTRYVEGARNLSVADGNLSRKNFTTVLDSLAEFLDTFAAEMEERWTDRDSVHLSSAGWQSLGLIYHDVAFRLKNVDRLAVARALAKIDWRRESDLWSKLVTEKVAKDGTVGLAFLGAGASTRRDVTEILRDRLGLTERLKEAEAA